MYVNLFCKWGYCFKEVGYKREAKYTKGTFKLVSEKWTSNVVAKKKKKKTKRLAQNRNLTTDQYEPPNKKFGMISGDPEGQTAPALLVVLLMVLMQVQTR